MTTPPAPPTPTPPAPTPPAPAGGDPTPPAPTPPAPPDPKGNGQPTPEQLAASVARLEAALAEERKKSTAAEQELAKARAAGMTEAEKAIADAHAAGKAEAVKAAGLQVAAAEFRAAATGKLTDPAKALEMIDLAKFVAADGAVDSKAITAAVDGLAAAAASPAPAPGRIPAGAQGAPAGQADFFGEGMRRGRGTVT